VATKKTAVDQELERLVAERATVAEELSHLREQMQAEVDVEPDEGDAEISEREKNATLIGVLERRILDIDAAIKAIESGSYGICTRCGNPIEPERLEIKPDATLCVTCQTEVERLSKRGRPTRQIEW
jgi:RNA polymerase-binding protein DksA